MLQDLCPRCGAEIPRGPRPCLMCGFDASATHWGRTVGRGVRVRRVEAIAVGLALIGLITISFGAGWRIGWSTADVVGQASQPTQAARSLRPPPVVEIGHVRFAERLGESLELEAYRTEFARDGTIAWRAELAEPPGTTELTVEIAWQSIRERMMLSRYDVAVTDDHLTVIGSEEVPITDLVPTAGLYAVSYFAGDMKVAEGIFEVLPPDN